MRTEIQNIVKKIVTLLANKEYEEIVKITNGNLSANEIKTAIDEFGEKIIIPTNDKFDKVDIIQIENSKPDSYSVDFDLWTEESGVSDLTLQLTVTRQDDVFETTLDNIHVL